MTRTASVAGLLATLAALAACGGDAPTAPQSPLGTFKLAYVLGVPVPATVKDPPSQMWIRYSRGSLVLRGDSTYDMQIDGQFRDFPDIVINGRHSGTFHWTRESGAIDLLDRSAQSAYRGTATADTVGLYCWFFGCSVPFPDQPSDFTFVRARD